MGPKSSTSGNLVFESSREFFVEKVDQAFERLRFDPLPQSRKYLVDVLQHFMFTSNLFAQKETLAELYLKSQTAPEPTRTELLKQLGDSSLYISGFFGDSLTRKVVHIDYYVDMGGVAFGALSTTAADEDLAQVYGEYAARFTGFVDALTLISQQSMIQTNEDLLKLYERYISTGSRLAEEQLLEKGLLNSDLGKLKTKM